MKGKRLNKAECVNVIFQDSDSTSFNEYSKQYSYIDFLGTKNGDIVIVDTRYGMKIAKVLNHDGNKDIATQCVLAVIDMDTVAEVRERKKMYESVKAEVGRINDRLDEKIANANREAILQNLAEKDKEVKELLIKLEELRGM